MQHARRARRAALLALSLLSACAAADPASTLANAPPSTRQAKFAPSGVYGAFLAGRFAVSQADATAAATDFLRALAARPNDPELLQQAFVACLMAGRAEAVSLARRLPENHVAQLLLADQDVKAGNWTGAAQRFRAMPRAGLTQLLQPLLLAWAQQGQGQTDAALATLQPFMESSRFRGIFTLHAAMIADLAGRPARAAQLYRTAQADLGDVNLRLGQVLASWYMRSGNPTEARNILSGITASAPDFTLVLPALNATAAQRPVAGAADGIAEAYLALAAALRAQDSSEFAMLMLRLAIDLRPDFPPARLLAAELLSSDHHRAAALEMLSLIPANDPLAPIVRLQRARILDREGQTDEAMRELDRLSQEYPASPVPDTVRGDMLRAKKHFAEAVTAYDHAIQKIHTPRASDWVVFYDRGIAYERSHQWPKAEEDLRKALQLSPDQPYVLNYLGYSLADRGMHLQEAETMIRKAAQLRPNDGAIVDSLGWVMLRLGDVQGAVNTLQRAVELEPEDPTLNSHLGDAYWAADRKLEAQYQWRRALTLNPSPEESAKLEAKLNTGHQGAVVSGANTSPGSVGSPR
jgi:Flp pilus assembly protein TadD